jgi:regulator of PEP synthase PpsR (kinase-PPPase family)
LGATRNQVGAVKELLQLDTYKAKLSYVQYEGPKVEIDLHDIYNENAQLPEHIHRITNQYFKRFEAIKYVI